MKKVTLMLSLAGLVSLSSSGFAQDATTNDQLAKQIAALQAQIDDLKKEVKKEPKDKKPHKPAPANVNAEKAKDEAQQKQAAEDYDSVSIGPYIGVDSLYSGSELIVNSPSINKDLAMLKVRQKQRSQYSSQGLTDMEQPRLVFSGYLEGQLSYEDNYSSDNTSDIDLTAAELDTFIEASEWVTGFAAFTYDNGSGNQANRVNNSNMELSQGFVTVGNLDKSPVYSSIGQMYVPFGSYTSYMITDPLTKTLGRIKARALMFGYAPQNEGFSPFASTYAYQGATEVDGDASNGQVHQYGFNLGTNYSKNEWSGRVGASYTSNIAESVGMQGSGSDSGGTYSGFAETSTTEDLAKDVPGVDVYALATFRDYTLISEYTTATEKFDASDMTYNGQAAQPQALDLQAVYEFSHWDRPNFIALDYGQSWQALALGVPERNIGTTYGISMWKHTLFSLELMHNWGYGSGSTATGSGMPVDTAQVGETYNSAMLNFDVYF
jgi:hypothetical protein